MPLFNSMMTAVSGGPQAIIEFGGFSYSGTTLFSYNTSGATIVSDPDGIIGGAFSPSSIDYFTLLNNTTYSFSVLQNYSSTIDITTVGLIMASNVNPPPGDGVPEDINVFNGSTFNNFQNEELVAGPVTPPFLPALFCRARGTVFTTKTVSGTLRLGVSVV